MQKLNKAIPYIFLFALSAIIACYLYGPYRHLIIHLFKVFLGDRVTFIGKGFFFFPPLIFVLSFAFFCCGTLFILRKSRQKFLAIFISLSLFFITSVLTSYLDSAAMIATCTACKDNHIYISFNNIAYSSHFVASLVIAFIPFIIAFVRIRKNHNSK
jgi:signal transduction histidine kinase